MAKRHRAAWDCLAVKGGEAVTGVWPPFSAGGCAVAARLQRGRRSQPPGRAVGRPSASAARAAKRRDGLSSFRTRRPRPCRLASAIALLAAASAAAAITLQRRRYRILPGSFLTNPSTPRPLPRRALRRAAGCPRAGPARSSRAAPGRWRPLLGRLPAEGRRRNRRRLLRRLRFLGFPVATLLTLGHVLSSDAPCARPVQGRATAVQAKRRAFAFSAATGVSSGGGSSMSSDQM